MNLLVCVKFVPDTEEVRTGADHTLVRPQPKTEPRR